MKDNARTFTIAGLLLAIALALLVGPFASNTPDGLNRVAIDKGFDKRARDHALDDSPVAGYRVHGVDNARVARGLSGLIGVLITFGVGLLLFGALRSFRQRNRSRPQGGAS